MLAHKQAFVGIGMMEEYNKLRRQLALTNQFRLPPIDTTLVEAFAALEILMSAVDDRQSCLVHMERMLSCGEVIENIPFKFKTCEEAGYIIKMIMVCGVHLRFGQTPNDFIKQAHRIWVRGSCQSKFANAKIRELLSKLQQWHIAFEPLMKLAVVKEVTSWKRLNYFGWNVSQPCSGQLPSQHICLLIIGNLQRNWPS